MDGVIYLDEDEVPICYMSVESMFKGTMVIPPNAHTRYGIVSNPWDVKNSYDYLKKERGDNNG